MSDVLTVDIESSLISYVEYNEEENQLVIYFLKYYTDKLVYTGISHDFFETFIQAPSPGKFYFNYIKPNFKQLNSQKMADKIIKCKINVREIIKKWIFSGEKGDYLNFTILYNEEPTVKEFNGKEVRQNGMIIQDVPSEIYKQEMKDKVPADKQTKGPILGNCVEFKKGAGGSLEASPGIESGKMGATADDDLPF